MEQNPVISPVAPELKFWKSHAEIIILEHASTDRFLSNI